MAEGVSQSSASRLAGAVGKETGFDLPEQEAYLNLLRTCGKLSSEFDRLFKSHGVSQPQYNVLRILRGHRGRAIAERKPEHGLPTQQISAEMVTREPDMTRLVDRLERAGLVERVRCDQDRRIVYVRITVEGLRVTDRLDEPVLSLHRSQLGHLSVEKLEQASRLLCEMFGED